MAELVPKVEACTANILDVLQSVRGASAGYQTTITKVSFATWFGIDPNTLSTVYVDGGVVLFEDDMEPSDYSPAQRMDWWQNYELQMVVMEPDTSLYRPRRRLQIMRADVVKALMADTTRGGNAHDTTMQAVQWISDAESVGAAAGIVIKFRCRIREDLYDPLASA